MAGSSFSVGIPDPNVISSDDVIANDKIVVGDGGARKVKDSGISINDIPIVDNLDAQTIAYLGL